jgi:hypothetical protein
LYRQMLPTGQQYLESGRSSKVVLLGQ